MFSCRDRRRAPRHGPRARLIYESFFDFGWRPVCSPHRHPLWTQLGEGCQRCIPPSLQLLPSLHYSPSSVSSRFFYSRLSALLRSLILEILFSAFLLTETSDRFLPASSLTPACLSRSSLFRRLFPFSPLAPKQSVGGLGLVGQEWKDDCRVREERRGSVRGGASWRGPGPELDRQ